MDIKKHYGMLSIAFLVGIAVGITILQCYNYYTEDIVKTVLVIENSQEIAYPKKNIVIEIDSQDDLRSALQNNKKPSVFFFHMDGCSWCEKVKPIFEKIVENPDFSSILFYSVDGQSSLAVSTIQEIFHQKISGFPTFIFMNEGNYIDKQVGFLEQLDFEKKLKQLFMHHENKIEKNHHKKN